MTAAPRQLTLVEWDEHYSRLKAAGLKEPSYGGVLSRRIEEGDVRLKRLRYDNSPAALDLWNFLLSEEDRLHAARNSGEKLVGTMKDLGTVPVMSYALPGVRAFYPDGAWWIPCVMELGAGLLGIADGMGIDESFCPVRAMLGAFATGAHFPVPDLLVCSAGAVCDDFSAIAQRLDAMGHPILWWEIPHRRKPGPEEESVTLPGGLAAPAGQVASVREELERIRGNLAGLAGQDLTDELLAEGISQANVVRGLLRELRHTVFTASPCPMPSLEMLIAEMLAIHFCSDRGQTIHVLEGLLDCVRSRAVKGQGYFSPEAVRVFWVNPVADLVVMNLLESCGARVCGTEYLFTHSLDDIPANLPPMDALARTALADPMVGPSSDRAERICRDASRFGAEAVIVSRIPGASHCALEGAAISRVVGDSLRIPVIEIEVPPVSDAAQAGMIQRIEALVETVSSCR